MDARIVSKGSILLIGMSFYGNPIGRASAWDADNEIGALWQRFLAFLRAHPGAIGGALHPGMPGYEVHVSSPEMAKTGRYEVFVGMEVPSLATVPVACCAKVLPGIEYAVVTVRGQAIVEDWMGKLHSEIIPGMGRAPDPSFGFELYDERFKGMDRLVESEIDYYIPLLPRNAS